MDEKEQALSAIEEIFGEADRLYVARKNQGGTNNERGGTYEARAAIVQILRLAQRVIEGSERITVARQIPEFVDDLQVCEPSHKRDYQLKDVQALNWSSAPHPLSDDFRKQNAFNARFHRVGSTQHVVVSSDRVAQRLTCEVPNDIKDHTSVDQISHIESVNRSLLEDQQLRDDVAYVCSSESAGVDKLEVVFANLLSAWDETPLGQRVEVLELLRKARKYRPSYMRLLDGSEPTVPPEAGEILASIPGFEFNVHRGSFHWKYGRTDSGQFGCVDKKFAAFIRQVLKERPTSFTDLENILIIAGDD